MNIPNLINIVLLIVSVLLSITIHEFSHGFMAYKQGDDTPKIYRRLTLNPLKHLDVFGTLCLILFKFGWAKPVPVNTYNFTDRKKGIILVSLAGPVSNLIVAFLSRVLFFLITAFYYGHNTAINYFLIFLGYITIINLGLCVFNLIPVPPLDGSKVLGAFLKGGTAYKYASLEKYTPVILLLLFWIPGISSIFSSFLNGVVEIVLNAFDTVIITLIRGIL